MAGIRDDVRHDDDEELDEELDEGSLDDLEFDEAEIDALLGHPDGIPTDDDEEDDPAPEGDDEATAGDAGDPAGAQPEEPQGDDAEQQQGEQGDGTPASDTTASEAAPPPAQPGEQAGTPAGQASGAAAAATGATPGQPEGADPEPLRFRSGGTAYEIKGSRVTDEGVFIPKERLHEVQHLLSRGRHHDTTWQAEKQTLESRVQAAERYRSEAEIQFTEYLKAFREMAEEAERTGDTAKVEEWFDNYRRELPRLDARAERAVLEYQRQIASQPAADARRADAGAAAEDDLGVPPEEIEREVRATVPKAFATIRDQPEFMDLSDEAVEAAERLLATGLLPRYFAVATRDDDARGIQRGAILSDLQGLAALAREQENIIRRQRQVRSTADAAADRNQRRGVAAGAAPAKPVTTQGAAPARGHIPPLPAEGDREGYEAWSQLPLSVREASSRQGRRAPKGKWSKDLKL